MSKNCIAVNSIQTINRYDVSRNNGHSFRGEHIDVFTLKLLGFKVTVTLWRTFRHNKTILRL